MKTWKATYEYANGKLTATAYDCIGRTIATFSTPWNDESSARAIRRLRAKADRAGITLN